jgi:hypothetical protein
MQNPVKERIVKLREEIAQISEANRLYLQCGKNKLDTEGDNARRLQRLQEILDELEEAWRIKMSRYSGILPIFPRRKGH